MRSIEIMLFGVCAWIAVVPSNADESPERWKCAVFLRSVVTEHGTTSVVTGSGFLLRVNGREYLVTADHIARLTTENTQVLVSARSKYLNLHLEDLGYSDSNPWLRMAGYDIAVLPIHGALLADALFIASECCQTELPAIKTELEFVGFPFALGVSEGRDLAPIVVDGRVASQEMNASLNDSINRAIVCTPSIADGTSGGPVFGRAPAGQWKLVGIAVGKLVDPTGAKLAKVASARVILALAANHAATQGSESQ